MYDEPDSMRIAVTVPKPLMNVSNGRLIKEEDFGDKRKFTWHVSNPINNYCVSLNIAAYVPIQEIYKGLKGDLNLRYYVLTENKTKAQVQFKQVKQMLAAFEHWLGPYPFYEDGYQLIEVPYLGMEHQSAVAYGNKFGNGYLGSDLSGTGWGLKWDYIIIHESGHEWFANNITYKDIADMWVHEGFTTYTEALYTEYYYGKEAGEEYVRGQRKNIGNDSPIIGQYDVNREGSGDMYYKGANMLNMIRQITNNDSLWRQMLIDMNQKYFYHKTIQTKDIEDFMSSYLNLNLKPIFDQYLRTRFIPVLESKSKNGKRYLRWQNSINGFEMPLDFVLNGKLYRMNINTEWQAIPGKCKKGKINVNNNYYIK
jgi:aminopeptidase N